MDADLHRWIYKHFQETPLDSAMELAVEFSYLGFGILLTRVVDRHKSLRKWDDSNLPMPMIFLRNLAILMIVNYWFIYSSLFDPESLQGKYCEKHYNITVGFVAPDYSLTAIATEFADAWKEFHPSNLRLVRMSHSILYPSILLPLTRRRLTTFLVWMLFIEIDFFHLLADMFHYVSGPALAEDRLDFQGGSKMCYVNVHFVQTMLAYPLNFVYLTTSMGDTSVPPQAIMQPGHEL